MALLDADGRPAVVGESVGYWLESSDFVFIGEDHQDDSIAEVGKHTFPRDWPDVYEESDALRALLRKRGPCAAKRVSVVPSPEEEHLAWVHGLEVRHLQSLSNAEAVRSRAGLAVIEGWAVFDLLSDVTGAAFVAERYWWNATEDGTWLDFSPRPENVQQLLLAEALVPAMPRKAVALTSQHKALGDHLMKLRFPKACRAPGRAPVRLVAGVAAAPLSLCEAKPGDVAKVEVSQPSTAVAPAAAEVPREDEDSQPPMADAPAAAEVPREVEASQPSTAISLAAAEAPREMEASQPSAEATRNGSAAPPPPPMSAEDAKARVKAVREGERDALLEALKQAEASAEACDRLVMAGMCGALVGQLRGSSAGAALRLLAGLGRLSMGLAAPGGGLYRRVSETLLAADGMQPLVEQISAKEMDVAALAAEALGHVCFRSPSAQVRAARAGAIRSLVRLFGRRREGGVREASYALWNLQVGQKEHAQAALREGAAAALLPLFTAVAVPADAAAEEALVNILGALTSLLLAEGAQDALGGNGVVEALCGYLVEDQPIRVRAQASAALANLLSGHGDNCRTAWYRSFALEPLLALLRLPPGTCPSAWENAAAALGNMIIATGPRAAQSAVDAGLLEALAEPLRSNVRHIQIFSLLANLTWHLPELRVQIFKMISVQRLVDLVRAADGEQAPRARISALALCANLASHGPAKTRLLKAGILPPIVNIVESSVDKALKYHAAVTLANILEGHPESVAKVFLDLPDLPRRLVYILNSNSSLQGSTRQQLTRAVALLGTREASRVSAKESGASSALAKLLDDATTAPVAAMGLLNLAPIARDRDNLLKQGVVNTLVQLLKQPEAKGYAAGALANLTAGSRTAARQAASAGAVASLAALLLEACDARSEGEKLEVLGAAENDVAAWALGAMAHIADLSDTRTVHLEAGSALPCMCQLLRDGHTAVQELAVFALGALVKTGSAELRILLRSERSILPALQQVHRKLPAGPLRERADALLRLAS